jgi:hypothetical protein
MRVAEIGCGEGIAAITIGRAFPNVIVHGYDLDEASVVADERVADEFTAPGDAMERFMYAASVLHCLPVGMVAEGSAATGTVNRSGIVRDYASGAGFSATAVLPLEHPQFRLYLLEG